MSVCTVSYTHLDVYKRQEKTDSQRAKVFTKIGREISVAVKEGGPDPAVNGKLRDLISKAKANNVPNDKMCIRDSLYWAARRFAEAQPSGGALRDFSRTCDELPD